jgi:hypothetical protein
LRNNIFINDQPFSLEVFNTSIYKLDSRFDVMNTLSYTDMPEALKSLATNLPEGEWTIAGITQEKAGKEFVRYNQKPWVIIDGKWWRLNPDRPDFRPRADSRLFAHRGDAQELPHHDLAGKARTGAAIGALEPEGKGRE